MKLFNTISGNIIESGTRFKRKLPHGELVKKTMSKRATGVFKLKFFLRFTTVGFKIWVCASKYKVWRSGRVRSGIP